MLSRITRTALPPTARLLPTATGRLLYQQRGINTSIHHPVTKSSDASASTYSENNETSTAEKKQGRANEIIEAVLYGSKKIKEEERQTHSKVLARGKYVHELQSKLFSLF
jgi:hypothetical protein